MDRAQRFAEATLGARIGDCEVPANIKRRRRIFLVAVFLAVIIGVAVFLLTRPPSAPPLSDLAIPSGATVIQDRTSGFVLQSDINANQYRFVLVAGGHGVSRRSLLSAEISALRERGWGPAGITESPGAPVNDVLTHPLESVSLHSAGYDDDLELSFVRTDWIRSGNETITPLSTPRAEQLIAADRPVMIIDVARASLLH